MNRVNMIPPVVFDIVLQGSTLTMGYRSLQDLVHLAADFQPFPHKLQDPGRLGCEEPPESIEAGRKKRRR